MGNGLILKAFFLAVAQMSDRRFRRVLMLGILLTFALLVASYAGLLWLVNSFVGEEATLPVLGEVRWLNDLLSLSSFIFMIILSIFLMVPVASAITSMFLDEVAQAVEDRHYPSLTHVPSVPFGEALRDTINFLGVLIGANILAIVLYVFFCTGGLVHLLGVERISVRAGIFHPGSDAPGGPGRGKEIAVQTHRYNLAGRGADGNSLVGAVGEPADPDPRGGDVYTYFPYAGGAGVICAFVGLNYPLNVQINRFFAEYRLAGTGEPFEQIAVGVAGSADQYRVNVISEWCHDQSYRRT